MRRHTFLAVAVFGVLLAGALFVLQQKPERGMSRISFSNITKESLTKIEVQGNEPVQLIKEKDVWHLADGKAADKSAVDRVIESIVGLSSSDLVSKGDKRFVEFEVDDAKGARVAAYASGKPVAEFVVGKTAATGGSYIRVKDSVYLVPSTYRTTFARAKASWLDRKLFDDKLEEVSRVEVGLKGLPAYALIKNENKWQVENPALLPKGFRFDANAAQSFVSALVGARAQDVPDTDPGEEKTQLNDGDWFRFRVTVTDEKGQKSELARELRLGSMTDSKAVYARTSTKPVLWALAEYTVKGLKKSATDFRDLTLMSFDPSKVRELEIRDGTRQLQLVKKEGVWSLGKHTEKEPAGFNFDPSLADRRVSALASSRGISLANGVSAASAGLNAARAALSAKLEDGKILVLSFGGSTKQDNQEFTYVRGNFDESVYLVNDWTRKNLLGGIESFSRRAAPNDSVANLDPKMLSGLPPDVRANLEKQIAEKQAQQRLMESLQKQAAGQKTNPNQK